MVVIDIVVEDRYCHCYCFLGLRFWNFVDDGFVLSFNLESYIGGTGLGIRATMVRVMCCSG